MCYTPDSIGTSSQEAKGHMNHLLTAKTSYYTPPLWLLLLQVTHPWGWEGGGTAALSLPSPTSF